MSFTKRENLINGESTIKITKEVKRELKIIKAKNDLRTLSEAIEFLLRRNNVDI